MTIRLLIALLAASCGFAETTVFKNFTLIDGSGGAPVASAAMIIVDGRIQWVGPAADLKAPAGAQTTDLNGKFVMPGIINLHGHLGNTKDLVQDPNNFTRESVEEQLKIYSSYGVTTMQSMGTEKPLILDMRAEQRRTGRPRETRIYTALRGFTAEGGYPAVLPGMKGVPYEVASVAEVKKDVDELASHKVDIVKIWVEDHLGKDRKIPFDLSKAIIENAHRHNLRVVAHVFYLDDSKMLVNAGLAGLAHSVRDKPVDDELIAILKKHNAWQMAATLTREYSTFAFSKPSPMLTDPFFAPSLSAKSLQMLKDPEYQKRLAADPDNEHGPGWFDLAKKNLKKLSDSGVKIGFGTDTGPPRRIPGYFEQLEMEFMADAGLKPQQIITIATKNSAEFLGAKDLGTLEKGKWADMIVLGRNPLDNIKNTRSIESVWIAGNKVK